jgi:hypothetical protein
MKVNLSQAWPQKNYYMFYQNRFAASAWPDYDGRFAFLEGKRNIVKHDSFAEPFGQAFQCDYFVVIFGFIFHF